MKKTLTYITLVLLAVVQTAAGRHIKIFGVLPNLVLTFTILYSLTNGSFRAGVLGLVAGLILDSASASVFGLNALLMMYTAIIASYFSRKFYYENKVASFCGVYIYTTIYESVLLILTQVMFSRSPFFSVFIRYILVESLINSILAIPILYAVKWLNNEYIRGI
ncbi:MAG: rod shape-determining protein MreD [Clostridia bacterium]|nr:rod shape-determining protein MreD [Clostridia bacterium]